MTNYKPVKIMFDIDDEYQLKLYKHIKERTNGSSYIRSLIYQDMCSNKQKIDNSIETRKEVMEEKIDFEPNTIEDNSERTIKINGVDYPMEEDEEVYIDDLI